MKTLRNINNLLEVAQPYEAPVVEILKVETEIGFATSPGEDEEDLINPGGKGPGMG
jgi:hypothetical protein